MDQLIVLSTSSFKKSVIQVASSRRINTGKVQILVALHFIKCLIHKLTMFGTYPWESVQIVLINITLCQEVSKAVDINFKVLSLSYGFFWLNMGLDHLQITSYSTVIAQVLPQLLESRVLLCSCSPFVVFLESNNIESINKQIWLDMIIKRWIST